MSTMTTKDEHNINENNNNENHNNNNNNNNENHNNNNNNNKNKNKKNEDGDGDDENMTKIEAQRAKSSFSMVEDIAPGLRYDMELRRILCRTSSKYQKIDVVETYYGKTLVTDGKTQSAQMDEFAYHESLVHPALVKCYEMKKRLDVRRRRRRRRLLRHDDDEEDDEEEDDDDDEDTTTTTSTYPRISVFIGGGGELATAREVLKHRFVKRVVMVDVDEEIIRVSKEYLPEWGGEAVYSDPRLEILVGDAHEYMMTNAHAEKENEDDIDDDDDDGGGGVFDVIIMDISDPIEAGPGIMLYTQEFYRHVAKTRLNPRNGVLVTQAGAAFAVPPPHSRTNRRQDTTCFGPIINTLRTVFDCVVPYSSHISSFGTDWGFVMAFASSSSSSTTTSSTSSTAHSTTTSSSSASVVADVDVDAIVASWQRPPSPKYIDDLIQHCLMKKKDEKSESAATTTSSTLKWYDGITHLSMFALSKPLRQSLEEDHRIMTKSDPIFMY